MAGLFRFYDDFFYGLGRSRFNFATPDTLKVALLDNTYIPNSGYGTRGGLLNYARGDVIYEAAYVCYFVCTTAGLSALGAPVFSTTPGATTADGTVVWTSCGLAPPSNHDVLADVVASEVTGTGYSAGGATCSYTHTIVGRRTTLGMSPILWTSSTISAKYAVLYKSGTVDAVTDPLIGYVLLNTDGTSMSTSSGTFRVKFGNDIAYEMAGV